VDWSPGQQAALDAAHSWLDDPKDRPIFRLFGPAGTGKTSLAQEIMSGRNATFAAFTGKAALVLRRKGNAASTIHSLIYLPKAKCSLRLKELEGHLSQARLANEPTDELEAKVRAERENVRRPSFSLNMDSELPEYEVLCLDEVSMVGSQIGNDLLSFNVPILALGDPFQLPPVRDGGFFTNAKPDVLLTEIHRQAADSPIIKMATIVRTGGDLEAMEYGPGCRVVDRLKFEQVEHAAYDQVLVGRNATRKAYNARYRAEVLGRVSMLPETGDRLVCLQNDHEKGLLNGGLWNVVTCDVVDDDYLMLTITDDDSGATLSTMAHRAHFEGKEDQLGPYAWQEAASFDYGYALTVHKAQGSEFDRVLLVDESACFRDSARRWLYTGITRAARELTVMLT